MKRIYQAIENISGIPLGGIGAGSVEIRPDGLFYDWSIFNVGVWSPESPCGCEKEPAIRPEDFIFALRVKAAGATVLRFLALRSDLHDLCSLPWIRCVEGIRFDGSYPIARLTYVDSQLPVQVEADIFSPFIPMDSRSSGTPGFSIRFNIRNLISEPVEVSILGTIRNPAGYDQKDSEPHNILRDIDGERAIFLTADNAQPNHSSTGNMTFAVVGDEISHVTGGWELDHRALAYAQNRFGRRVFSLLHQFRDDGALPNLNAEHRPHFPDDFQAGSLSDAEIKALRAEMLQHPSFYDEYQRISAFDQGYADSRQFLDDLADHLREIKTWPWALKWGAAYLCSKSTIQPSDEAETRFVVGWYFPNHISATGANIGHAYEQWFKDSLDVVKFINTNYSDLRAKTFAFNETFAESSLPEEVADAVTSQLSTLIKSTWWTREGHFGVWEGLGCCGFNTTDITYQGSFPIISLFPDLQKQHMLHSVRFQRADGRVAHYFTPDFSRVDNEFERVDMNPQFVMLAARDYLWTGDRDYLEQLWPNIIQAMHSTLELDKDGDGLPDSGTSRNTYDYWDFRGCPSYISSLWLGALQAAIILANEMNETQLAADWQAIYERASAAFEEKLWNGDYYVLWRDGDQIDECCMTDQLSGEWFCSVCGWEPMLDRERVRRALEVIVRHNYADGAGLLNASYPPGKRHRQGASGNSQADACWTGIEYATAALMINRGLVKEGLAVVKDIDDRYSRAGRNWNHVECGNHYYRAMSSWSLLLALSGFGWDKPRGRLTFAPVTQSESWMFPFFCSGAWGTLEQNTHGSGKQFRITLTSGELAIRELNLPGPPPNEVMLSCGSKKLDCAVEECAAGMSLRFRQPVTIKEGERLDIECAGFRNPAD